MAKPMDVNSKFNLSTAVVLIIDRNTHSADVVSQILSGFGVHNILRSQRVEQAHKLLAVNNVDLVIIDPELEDDDGFEFVRDLRRSAANNHYAPIILVSGHARISSIWKARDCGANFFVAKPITPAVLLQRIYWVAGDHRKFLEEDVGAYVGPDRRFKREGPPVGSDGRRQSDLSGELGAQVAENLSEAAHSDFLKPQKILI